MKSYDKVIFVSKGNTFSSPLVEAIYRMKAPNWLPNSISRGTVVLFSEPINPKVNVLLSSHDMNISNHENSKQLKREEITADISDPFDPDETLYDKFFEDVSEKIEKVILHMEAEYHENEESATNINN